ncbi:potassium channel family protein [bacterium]|nr:potassium channel family protein [bacterium]MCI0607120.1 potassium channel family protein [bacterium]
MDTERPSTLQSWLAKKNAWEDQFAGLAKANPLESVLLLLLVSSAIYYKAEAGTNPKVKTFVDALNFISTCASVGYTDIFAQTQTGRLVSTVVMTLGPALTAKVLDRPGPDVSTNQAIVQKLDAILTELRLLRENSK